MHLDTLTDTEIIALYHALAAELWRAPYRHMPRLMGYEKIRPLLDERDGPADPLLVQELMKRTMRVRRGRKATLYGVDEAAAFLGRKPESVWYAVNRGDLPRHGGRDGYPIDSLYFWEDELIAFQRGRPMPPEPHETVMDAATAAAYLFGADRSGRERLFKLYAESDAGRIRHFRVGRSGSGNARYLFLKSDLLDYQTPDDDPGAYGRQPEDRFITLQETGAEWGVQPDGQWGFTPLGRWVLERRDGRQSSYPGRTRPAPATAEESRRLLQRARYYARKEWPPIPQFSYSVEEE